MSEIYILTLHTTWSDLDIHYEEYVLGVYTSKEKAEKACDKFVDEHLDEHGRLDVPCAYDDWSFTMDVYDIDCDPSGPRPNRSIQLKNSEEVD